MAARKVARRALKALRPGRKSTVQQFRASKNGLRTARRRTVAGATGSPRVRATGRANPGARVTGRIQSSNEKLRGIAGARGPLRFTRRTTGSRGAGGRQG